MRKLLLLALSYCLSISLWAQPNFSLQINPLDFNGLGGLQSFAWGKAEGKWLLIGGRTDGLHRRQPFASFDPAGNNTQLIVFDPATQQIWSNTLGDLPTALQEQLSATNIEFFQENNHLFLVGGYGYSPTNGDHTTFPLLTRLSVSNVINAIINNQDIAPFFHYVEDDFFAVTGGQLEKLNDTFYLVGGQKFEGRYNPMGPDHGPGFFQEYTNAIRKFTLSFADNTLAASNLEEIKDTVNLHRRDYNMLPQIFPNGTMGYTAFSGVFQYDADVPFLNSVDIFADDYEVNNDFAQFYNHYHCAKNAFFSTEAQEMYNLFYGGIAQYYDSLGVMIQDDEVPFVKTVACVSRDAQGVMKEYKMAVEMPDYIGASAEFIPAENLPVFENGVIQYDLLPDTAFLGYIYGGIIPSSKNIFWNNEGDLSDAENRIFTVTLIKDSTTGFAQLNPQSIADLRMQIFPNPADRQLHVTFSLNYLDNLTFQLIDLRGNTVFEQKYSADQLKLGNNSFGYNLSEMDYGKVFIATVFSQKDSITQKLIINP
ncbi:MAG: hypothetical protein R2798_12935 [Chitinophagales bacterium]|nr:T9SS type A sorting domain-containing protein [Bacteroidota bacterium]MCB9042484.1 T9SS type A sorting domain-containing protein [Chitinophagales bacterium]